MLSFKEQVKEDLNMFFNLDEFAEKHYINGFLQTIVIDNELLKKRIQKEYDGILQADLLYFIKSSDISKKVKVGDSQKFDNGLYTVIDVKYDAGMYEIILQGARS